MRSADYLLSARTELLEGDGDDRLRLRNAGRCFRAALSERPDWPPEAEAHARSLRERLGIDRPHAGPAGPIAEAVAAMDDETVRELSNELWQFVEFHRPH